MGRISTVRRPSGIKKRWLYNCVSVVLLLVILAVTAFAAIFANYYYSSVRSSLEAKAKTASDFFGSYMSQSYNEYYINAYRFIDSFDEKNTLELQFVNTRGRIVASSYGLTAGTAPGTSDITDAMETQDIGVFMGNDPVTGEHIMAVSSPMVYAGGDVIGVMRYVTSLRIVDKQILIGILMAMAIGTVIMLFVIFSNLYFIRSIVNPVARITETAKRIAAGSYGVQIEDDFADDEIGELADTINYMSLQIDRSEKMQTEFVTQVSHELRTPLTAIAGWGETLLYDDGSDPEETKKGISIMLKETNRLTRLVEELLEFSRMQDGRFKLSIEQCDIRAEFEDTVFMYGSKLRQEDMDLEYLDNDQDIPEIPADAQRMKQVFLNILDNAAKHGKEGGRITAEIRDDGDDIAIAIRDFGPGIPEEELPFVKKKFYKGSSKERGNGIGLAVCEEIVTMHNGSLDIENAQGGGALVTIRLPKN